MREALEEEAEAAKKALEDQLEDMRELIDSYTDRKFEQMIKSMTVDQLTHFMACITKQNQKPPDVLFAHLAVYFYLTYL